jgi:protein-disulfide isomerase
MRRWVSIQALGEAELIYGIGDSSTFTAQKRSLRLLKAAKTMLTLLLLAAGAATTARAQTTSSPKPATSTAKPTAKPAHAAASPKTTAALGAPVKTYGSSNAPITMEVFSDYECPSCRNLFELTLRQMIPDYVAAGKVYLIHRDYPLPMHKYGYEAARWLNASARIGQFQSVEAALYDNQNAWAQDGNIEKYIAAAMSPADFKRVQSQMRGCGVESAASVKPAAFALGGQSGTTCSLDSYIEQDRALGNKIPVQSTPTYVITYKGNRLPVGSGTVSWPILKQFFDSLLSQ